MRSAQCQGLTNVFGSGGILEGSNYVSEALRVAAESIVVDDVFASMDYSNCNITSGNCTVRFNRTEADGAHEEG